MRSFNTKLATVPAAATAALVASPAFAQATGPDFTVLTDAVSFESTSTAVLSVGGLAIGLALVVLGIRKIMGITKGA